jgi:uncharacterized phage protein gp47/JayE
MPFSRPTLSQIRSQTAADIASAKPGADALLRFSNLQMLGAVLSGMCNAQYGYLDWIAKQAVPFTATDENLLGWGALKKVFLKDPVAAKITVTYSGATPGTLLPALTEITRGDGATFTTSADETVDGSGNVVVTANADVPGAAGNCDVGTVLRLGEAIDGIPSNGTVTTTITVGADLEEQEDFRSRMLEVYQNPPQGGAKTDYIEWALQIPGVTRAWCTPNGMGIGTVVVYTMFDVSEQAHNGFPQGTDGVAAADPRATAATGDQLEVANYIYSLQPVTALVYSVSPIANPINFTISGLSGASSATKAAISAAIAGVFVLKGAPGGTIDLSDIEAAIIAIPGTEGFVITSPSANITNPTGNLPTLGTITYI